MQAADSSVVIWGHYHCIVGVLEGSGINLYLQLPVKCFRSLLEERLFFQRALGSSVHICLNVWMLADEVTLKEQCVKFGKSVAQCNLPLFPNRQEGTMRVFGVYRVKEWGGGAEVCFHSKPKKQYKYKKYTWIKTCLWILVLNKQIQCVTFRKLIWELEFHTFWFECLSCSSCFLVRPAVNSSNLSSVSRLAPAWRLRPTSSASLKRRSHRLPVGRAKPQPLWSVLTFISVFFFYPRVTQEAWASSFSSFASGSFVTWLFLWESDLISRTGFLTVLLILLVCVLL